jgi:hypothetical protein
LSDADVNLIQDIQDQKRQDLLGNTVFSGVLGYEPFEYNTQLEGFLGIKPFNVLFNGEIVHITGARNHNGSSNLVSIPAPKYWYPGQDPLLKAKIFVVYLELWYAYLDVETGNGYFVSNSGQRFFYPEGCIDAPQSKLIPDDVVDPFEQLKTTGRVQIQWALRTSPLPLSYSFSGRPSGLDKGPGTNESVWAKALANITADQNTGFEFSNMGNVNGDFGLWRAGDGDENGRLLLKTLDGFSYAMPLALVFQRNTGKFDITDNPLGCSDGSQNSGLRASSRSGRYDLKFADIIYEEDVVDTRKVVQLQGEDPNVMLNRGFSDLITGITKIKPSRGNGLGNDPFVLGSRLPYVISIGQEATSGTDYLGSFDTYMNGFSSDERTFSTTKVFTTSDKSQGTKGSRWASGDTITINLDDPKTPVRAGAVVKTVLAQFMSVNQNGEKKISMLYTGQTSVVGVGTRVASLTLGEGIEGSPFDPVSEPLFITLGITYPASSGYDLKVLPHNMPGGTLYDPITLKTLPVFGISEYAVKKEINFGIWNSLQVINPNYSQNNFGTRIVLLMNTHDFNGTPVGVAQGSNTVFSFPRTGLLGKYTAIYGVSVKDNSPNGGYLEIIRSSITDSQLKIEVKKDLIAPATRTTLVFTLELIDTAQANYNAPVRGIISLEETVVVGKSLTQAFPSGLISDSRIRILSQQTYGGNTHILLGADNCILKGIGGIDSQKLIFVFDTTLNSFISIPLTSATIFRGMAEIILPSFINLTQSWFLVASILPSFTKDCELILESVYTPYQGEGIEGREYSILYSEDSALVTTNGTGTSPVPGLRDVFPFNREIPIIVPLPKQSSWKDSDLTNQPISLQLDSNFEAKRQSNIEHTVKTSLHTNDFIEPLSGWKRKSIRLRYKGSRGFTSASPHVGFAIHKPKVKNVLGDSVLSTSAPITLYVNNVQGSDNNDGLFSTTPKKTIQAALEILPPVISHPVNIYLINTGVPFKISQMLTEGSIKAAVIGSGAERTAPKNYCIFNLSFELQEAGRILIGKDPQASSPIEISAIGALPIGDGPTSAFVVDDSRVTFQGLKFVGFTDAALRVLDSDVEFIDCEWEKCVQIAAIEEGSSCILNGGQIKLETGTTGFVLSDSSLTSSGTSLISTGLTNAFFVASRGSNITLRKHDLTKEVGITNSSLIVLAKINSSVVCSSDFESKGYAKVYLNSIITKSTAKEPFQGGVQLGSTTEKDNSIMNTDLG